jgi:hypothetical protein
VDKVDDFVFIPVDQCLEIPGVTIPDRAHHIIIGKYLLFFYHFTIITDFTPKSCGKIGFVFNFTLPGLLFFPLFLKINAVDLFSGQQRKPLYGKPLKRKT